MNGLALCFTLLFSLAAGAIALAMFAILRANWQTRRAVVRTEAETGLFEAALKEIREEMTEQARQLQELRDQPVPGPLPKSGLNLNKRSQALRMHRRGDPPEKIAAALELPLQEVELMLKVHRIVMADL